MPGSSSGPSSEDSTSMGLQWSGSESRFASLPSSLSSKSPASGNGSIAHVHVRLRDCLLVCSR
eukprot:10707479-Alexandrium_andersonii.AAC.1